MSEQELDLGIKRSIAAFRAVMEELAGGDQLVPGGHDVGDDQECLGRTGSGRRDVLAEMARAAGARRRELDQAKIFAGGAEIFAHTGQTIELTISLEIELGEENSILCGFSLVSAAANRYSETTRTKWRWRQSRANRSPGPDSLLSGINTGIFHGLSRVGPGIIRQSS